MLGRDAPGAAFPRAAAEQYPALAGAAAPPFEPKRAHPSVVAVTRLAVAEPGSLAVAAPSIERGASYLAEHRWLVVRRADSVPSIDAALAQIVEAVRSGLPYITSMSGPSRTADVKRVLMVGVHGPRRLIELVVAKGTGVRSSEKGRQTVRSVVPDAPDPHANGGMVRREEADAVQHVISMWLPLPASGRG